MLKCKIAMEDGNTCERCCFFCDLKETCPDVCYSMEETCEEQVMDDLMTIQSAVPEALQAITEITIQMKKLEEQSKVFRERLLEAMEQNGITKFENEKVSFTYVAPTTKTAIDSTKLKKLYPDIAQECSKTSPVKASVRISVK